MRLEFQNIVGCLDNRKAKEFWKDDTNDTYLRTIQSELDKLLGLASSTG
jgi:hypothetical protein